MQLQANGIIVTLTDTRYSKINAYDITELLNALREAGAEAISINEQRIVYDSYASDINNTFITIKGKQIVSPYIVKAIGNTTYLESGISQKQYGYIDTKLSEGKSVVLERQEKIKIPAYTGDLNFEYVNDQ